MKKHQKQNSLCISVRGFKRSDCLKRCLEALGDNEDIEKADFHFIQDGNINKHSGVRYAKPEEIEKSIDVFESFPHPFSIKKFKHNVGCANHKYYQLSFLFDEMGYDYVTLMDNDCLVNRYYIRTLLTLFEQFKGNQEAGILQLSTRAMNRKESEERRDENLVTHGFGPRSEIGIWRETWEKIRDEFSRYHDRVKEVDFRQLILSRKYASLRSELIKTYGTEHADRCIENLAIKHGYKGLVTVSKRYMIMPQVGWYTGSGGKYLSNEYANEKLYNIGNVSEYKLSSSGS